MSRWPTDLNVTRSEPRCLPICVFYPANQSVEKVAETAIFPNQPRVDALDACPRLDLTLRILNENSQYKLGEVGAYTISKTDNKPYYATDGYPIQIVEVKKVTVR